MSRCCWTSDGEQCEFPGSMSESVLGGDRWYCAHHFRGKDPFIAAEIVERSKRWARMPNRIEAWNSSRTAEVYSGVDNPAVAALRARLIPRKPAGKSPLAKWLPKPANNPDREPGQDDEEAA